MITRCSSFLSKARTPTPLTRVSKLSSAVPRLRNPSSTTTHLQQCALPLFPSFQNHMQGLEACYHSWAVDNTDKALMVSDLGIVERQVQRWASNLPGVQPFYAVKCNPDPILVTALANWGANFDCASRGEIQLVLNCGVDPSRIIFANPIKTNGDIRFSHSVGVRKMTFDNVDEIHKIKAGCPDAQLVLRLLPDDSGSVMRFGSKFGAPFETVEGLLRECQRQDLDVVGCSFHIGSGCFDSSKYDSAIALCRQSFEVAQRLGMPPMSFVDVGGGFPGDAVVASERGVTSSTAHAPPPFEEIAAVIRAAFDCHFPQSQYPQLVRIGEPGRYFGKAYSTLFLRVQGRRAVYSKNAEAQQRFLYYVNDGVYGSFNCKLFDYYHPTPIPTSAFFGKSQENVKMTLGTFFGPTCDSLDKIVEDFPVPELKVGDHIVFTNMGAYTSAAATEFNGCPLSEKVYIHSLDGTPAGTTAP